MSTCPCGTGKDFDECCGPIIKGATEAGTAEALMRSRYSAYAMRELDYLYTTLHPESREDYNAKSTRKWAESAEWHELQIVSTRAGGPGDVQGSVEFIATFSEDGIRRDHHELASFRKEDGRWYFVNGELVPPKQYVREAPKVGRNDPCPCGSGRKFKKCCG